MDGGCARSTDCRAVRPSTDGPLALLALVRRAPNELDHVRLLEVATALLLLILFAPLIVVVSAALIACGRHPLFQQKRVGRRQAEFTILKFQTLCPNRSARAPASRLKRIQDHAFAGLSRVLRQSRLDELPQLVNIVRGDMALIGPRPLVLNDVSEMPASRARRFEVRPGLTGLAQVSGGQALGPAAKLELDLLYIETRSPRLSLWILGRTCLVPFKKDRPRAELPRAVTDVTRRDVMAQHEPRR